jgi:hypothetical protein
VHLCCCTEWFLQVDKNLQMICVMKKGSNGYQERINLFENYLIEMNVNFLKCNHADYELRYIETNIVAFESLWNNLRNTYMHEYLSPYNVLKYSKSYCKQELSSDNLLVNDTISKLYYRILSKRINNALGRISQNYLYGGLKSNYQLKLDNLLIILDNNFKYSENNILQKNSLNDNMELIYDHDIINFEIKESLQYLWILFVDEIEFRHKESISAHDTLGTKRNYCIKPGVFAVLRSLIDLFYRPDQQCALICKILLSIREPNRHNDFSNLELPYLSIDENGSIKDIHDWTFNYILKIVTEINYSAINGGDNIKFASSAWIGLKELQKNYGGRLFVENISDIRHQAKRNCIAYLNGDIENFGSHKMKSKGVQKLYFELNRLANNAKLEKIDLYNIDLEIMESVEVPRDVVFYLYEVNNFMMGRCDKYIIQIFDHEAQCISSKYRVITDEFVHGIPVIDIKAYINLRDKIFNLTAKYVDDVLVKCHGNSNFSPLALFNHHINYGECFGAASIINNPIFSNHIPPSFNQYVDGYDRVVPCYRMTKFILSLIRDSSLFISNYIPIHEFNKFLFTIPSGTHRNLFSSLMDIIDAQRDAGVKDENISHVMTFIEEFCDYINRTMNVPPSRIFLNNSMSNYYNYKPLGVFSAINADNELASEIHFNSTVNYSKFIFYSDFNFINYKDIRDYIFDYFRICFGTRNMAEYGLGITELNQYTYFMSLSLSIDDNELRTGVLFCNLHDINPNIKRSIVSISDYKFDALYIFLYNNCNDYLRIKLFEDCINSVFEDVRKIEKYHIHFDHHSFLKVESLSPKKT